MTKKTLGGVNLLKDATKKVRAEKIDLNATVLMTHEQIQKLQQPKEKRTAGRMVYITPTEMETFLSLIGRETYSNAVRELILAFIDKHNDKLRILSIRILSLSSFVNEARNMAFV